MQKRFVKALKPFSTEIYMEENLSMIRKTNPLSILKKNYRLRNKNIPIYESPIPAPKSLILQANISINNKNTCQILIPTNIPVSSILKFLINFYNGNYEFSFLQIKKYILSVSLPNFEEAPQFIFKDVSLSLSEFVLFPDLEMFFFDGEFKNYSIKVKRIFYDDLDECKIVEIYDKGIICKGCCKNVSKFFIIDDPILPANEKHLCKECFDLLFIDEKGSLRYKNIKYCNL